MRLPTAQRLALLAGVCLSGVACSEQGPPRKETYPVTGQVYVDGAPANYLAVTCHDTKGMDAAMPTVSSAFTGEDGGFSISTYESGDGVPAGDYVLTFMWGQKEAFSGRYGGPDKLNNRYTDPKDAPVRFTVEAGKPTDLGRIELTKK
ncbi:MAG: hypothetical protein PHO07_02475 [Pirellulales bacterium]|nr:hypothetical protein [Thermoguttaceae bacterium]MDD4786012.1 hypothetical protein [Pirellulales bacterium]MDI9446896.1 hypothetical protein [Planctomycetota bacterium]NLZ00111.1 hypothetical protein [Pirellulaceae bacterium]